MNDYKTRKPFGFRVFAFPGKIQEVQNQFPSEIVWNTERREDMEDLEFKQLFRRIVDRYELDPVTAAELLRRILAILKNRDEEHLQTDTKYEILMK